MYVHDRALFCSLRPLCTADNCTPAFLCTHRKVKSKSSGHEVITEQPGSHYPMIRSHRLLGLDDIPENKVDDAITLELAH